MLCVGTTFEEFFWVYEEEECNTGEVTDVLLPGSSWAESVIQSMENVDGYWADPGMRRIQFLVGRELLRHQKIQN